MRKRQVVRYICYIVETPRPREARQAILLFVQVSHKSLPMLLLCCEFTWFAGHLCVSCV